MLTIKLLKTTYNCYLVKICDVNKLPALTSIIKFFGPLTRIEFIVNELKEGSWKMFNAIKTKVMNR